MHAPRQLAAVGDDHRLGGLAGLAAHPLHGAHDLHALDHLAEDDMLAIQPGCAGKWLSARPRRSAQGNALVCTVHRKNWEPFVPGPALAIDRMPSPVCFSWKFSSCEAVVQALGLDIRQ